MNDVTIHAINFWLVPQIVGSEKEVVGFCQNIQQAGDMPNSRRTPSQSHPQARKHSYKLQETTFFWANLCSLAISSINRAFVLRISAFSAAEEALFVSAATLSDFCPHS